MTPEENLARRFVELHDLTPPVDIFQLAQQYAKVTWVDWPCDSDAITVDLVSPTGPRMFIGATGKRWRERFTVAHELGHVLLPWHYQLIACHPRADIGNPNSFTREREASTFASGVLLPDRYIRPVVESTQVVSEWLEAVAAAEISAAAGILGLTDRILPPGIAFVVSGVDRPFMSRGTTPPVRFGATNAAGVWERTAVASGKVRHQNRDVGWYRFVDYEEMPEAVDPRPISQILADAIMHSKGNPVDKLRWTASVNGVFGAADLAATLKGYPNTAYNKLLCRFKSKPELAPLLAESDFRIFLASKVRQLTT